jgi:hypothetical protein
MLPVVAWIEMQYTLSCCVRLCTCCCVLPNAAQIIFDASMVVGDSLFIVFQNLDKVARMALVMDLHTGIVKDGNFYLVSDNSLLLTHEQSPESCSTDTLTTINNMLHPQVRGSQVCLCTCTVQIWLLLTTLLLSKLCYLQSSGDSVELLDFPVVSVMTLGTNGGYPHLAAVASRQLVDATTDSIRWYGKQR